MAKQLAIGWHPYGHSLFLAPDFSPLSLSDDSAIGEALEIVLTAKKKTLMPAEKDALIHKVSKLAGSVGELRGLSDEDWSKFSDEIPWMCRVYLKHIVEQSTALTRQQLLECEFYSGLPLDLDSMKEDLQQLMTLGLTRDEALEGLVVCNGRVGDAAQYMTSDEETRAVRREAERKRRAQSVAANRHWTIIEQKTHETEQLTTWVKKTVGQLELQLNQLKRKLTAERKKTQRLDEEVTAKAKQNAVALYTEYLKATMADPIINATEVQRLDEYKRQRDITEADHSATLKAMYCSEEKFEGMKDFITETANDNDECVVCYEPPRDHMLMPCNHVCLCAECAEEYASYGDDGVCPLCDEPIKEIRQVYYR